MTTDDLTPIAEVLRETLETANAARDTAVTRSRELIRHCSECIRAIHRREWDEADAKLEVIKEASQQLKDGVAGLPELYHTGYTQDALKEVVEAHLTRAIVRDESLPSPVDLDVEASTYLLGMAEAATELRRFILDILRRTDGHSEEAERLLEWMDAIYDQLVTFDFPDALTHGLRRQTDIVRGVLERTRGDMTHTLRQERLQAALERFEARMNAAE